MWQTILLSLLAGAMGANATPHFVKGITKEPYPNVFGGSPVSNLVAGWSGFVLAALLLSWAHADRHPVWAFVSAALGVLLMGLFHALGLVVGTTSNNVAWQRTRVNRGDVATEFPKLKQQPGKDIGVSGSVALVRSLLRLGLLDRLQLQVYPVALGSTGTKPIFDSAN